MDNSKKPEEQVNAAEPQLTQAELDKVAGGSASTGGGGGKAILSDISITKNVDLASPKLYE
jgi:type VI protein secretion system component Hcp